MAVDGDIVSHRWLWAATALGLVHGAVTLMWLLGSTWLLAAVGGQLEDWGRDGGVGVRLALAAVLAAKLVAVALVWLAIVRPTRIVRALAWVTTAVLATYGGALTIVGITYVLLGPVDDAANPSALRWHAFFWDPWFLVWGLCGVIALRVSRRRPGPAAGRLSASLPGR